VQWDQNKVPKLTLQPKSDEVRKWPLTVELSLAIEVSVSLPFNLHLIRKGALMENWDGPLAAGHTGPVQHAKPKAVKKPSTYAERSIGLANYLGKPISPISVRGHFRQYPLLFSSSVMRFSMSGLSQWI
jgi:hypothetical protein